MFPYNFHIQETTFSKQSCKIDKAGTINCLIKDHAQSVRAVNSKDKLFHKGPDSKYLKPYSPCHKYCVLLLQHQSSHRLFINKWTGLSSNKTLFKKKQGGARFGPWVTVYWSLDDNLVCLFFIIEDIDRRTDCRVRLTCVLCTTWGWYDNYIRLLL